MVGGQTEGPLQEVMCMKLPWGAQAWWGRSSGVGFPHKDHNLRLTVQTFLSQPIRTQGPLLGVLAAW